LTGRAISRGVLATSAADISGNTITSDPAGRPDIRRPADVCRVRAGFR
jgi:hypothetical protein